MNRRTGISILAVAVLVVSGADVATSQWWSSSEKVRGSGDVTTENRDVGDVQRVDFAMNGTLTITLGDEVGLTIEAEDNLIEGNRVL